ncbi:odorant receptor 4-like [Epargyreus clarus]|uniref:odorant receptor 4-like n=1 Tax=Epargyreus clarus TaxID=520877 RepID=UPI003C2ED4CA
MEQMEEYPFEFAKPLLLCFDLLSRCNIGFFDENVPFVNKYWHFSYMIPFVVIHYMSMTGYMSKVFTGQVKVSELAFMVPVYLIQMQGFLKALILMPRKSNITKLIIQLGTTWRTANLTDEQISKKNSLLKSLNLSHAVFYWGSIFATWQNIIAPLALTLFRRFVLHQECELQLPFGCVFPFNPVKNWYIYILTYAFQTYTMFRVVYYYIGTEFLMITLCAHLTTEFTLLREDLLGVEPFSNDVMNDRMRLEEDNGQITIQQFVCRHQKLIQLSKDLNFIFNRMIFIDLLFATVIMCFFGFGATVASGAVDKANNYIAVLALMFPIYVFCYYGELLKEESAGIADSSYNNLWYRGGTQYQKAIRFIIMRSQRPCCLTSLEYTPITLNTFTKVVSTTWSYFSLAISVYSED